jgi:hypothetical protein
MTLVTIDSDDPRTLKAIEIAAGAGEWLKCRTREGGKAYGILRKRGPIATRWSPPQRAAVLISSTGRKPVSTSWPPDFTALWSRACKTGPMFHPTHRWGPCWVRMPGGEFCPHQEPTTRPR